MKLKDTDEIFADDLRNPAYAAGYVNISLEEDGIEGLLYSLQKVAKAHGMSRVAEKSGLNREALYRSLSATSNPGIKTVCQVASAMSLRLAVIPAFVEHLEVSEMNDNESICASASPELSESDQKEELITLISEVKTLLANIVEIGAPARNADKSLPQTDLTSNDLSAGTLMTVASPRFVIPTEPTYRFTTQAPSKKANTKLHSTSRPSTLAG